jgi:nicotinamidase-related amidase
MVGSTCPDNSAIVHQPGQAMNPPVFLDAQRSALVLVDYQRRLMPAIHRGAEAVAHAARLADVARELSIAIIGTEQNPRGLGPNEDSIRSRCATTISKVHFDACADGLLDQLRAPGQTEVRDVVIAGCEAHVCLMQTALGLMSAGFNVWVVAQACGSRSAQDHELAMQRLRDAGALIVSVEMVAFEWLRSCEHERFRAVLALLKEAPIL